MGIQEDVLRYLLTHGKENKYKMATTLKIDVGELTKALGALEQQGKIEMKTGRVIPIKGNPPKTEQGLGEDKPEDQTQTKDEAEKKVKEGEDRVEIREMG